MTNTTRNSQSIATARNDKYINMEISLGMLLWNILLYYLHSPVYIVLLCCVALLAALRIYWIFQKKQSAPIDGTKEKIIELSVSLVWLATGIIQSFWHTFPDWWRVATFAVAGLIIGMNIAIVVENRRFSNSGNR